MQRKKSVAFLLSSALVTGICGLLLSVNPVSGALAGEESELQKVPALDISRIAEGCQGCHQGALDLSQNNAGVIADQIRAVQSGQDSHPSPIPPLDDNDVDALAELLARE